MREYLPIPTVVFEMPTPASIRFRHAMRRAVGSAREWLASSAQRNIAERARRTAARKIAARERARMEIFIRSCAADGRVTLREVF